MVDETVATNVKYKDDEQRRAFRAAIAKKGITAQDIWQQVVRILISTSFAPADLAEWHGKLAGEIVRFKNRVEVMRITGEALEKQNEEMSMLLGCNDCDYTGEKCQIKTGMKGVCQWRAQRED